MREYTACNNRLTIKWALILDISHNRGIIEHEIISDDLEYHGLKIRGVEADVLDNDGNLGYVSVVDQGGFHLMSEDNFGFFSFWVFPTRVPEDDIVVNIVAPAARDTNRYVHVNGNWSSILNFTKGEEYF